MRLELHNFEAISKATVDFEPGLTMLEGSNSVGKSALLRSIWSILYNGFPTSSLKYGKNAGSIKLYLDDKWVETGKNSSGVYLNRSDNVSLERCGRDYPGAWEFLQFPKKDNAGIYNFAMQGSGSVIKGNSLYSVLFDDVEVARSIIKSCKLKVGGQKKSLEESLVQTNNDLEMLSKLKDLVIHSNNLKEQSDIISGIYEYMQQKQNIEVLKNKISTINSLAKLLEEKIALLNLAEEVKEYIKMKQAIVALEKKADNQKQLINLLLHNTKIIAQKDVLNNIYSYYKELNQVKKLQSTLNQVKLYISALEKKQRYDVYAACINSIYNYHGLKEYITKLKSKLKGIQEIGNILRVINYVKTKKIILQLQKKVLDFSQVNIILDLIGFCQLYEKRRDLHEKLSCYKQSLELLIAEIGECPVCGSILDKTKIIGGRIK